MKDAFGDPLKEGDYVAYCRRIGSSMRIERRLITKIYEGVTFQGDYLNLDGGSGRVKPYNVVKCYKQ